MGIKNGKGRREVGKEHRRMMLSRILALAVLTTFLATIPSISITGLAFSGSESEMTETDEEARTIGADSEHTLFLDIDPATNGIEMKSREGFKVTPMGYETFTIDPRPNPVRQKTDQPSPQGTPDPEPTDAPFQDPDILVYNDLVNSEKNASIAASTGGELYIAYDHDPGVGLRDVYVSKSIDGGSTWMQRDIAVDIAEDEACPSIASDSGVTYVWYNNPTLEFAWSSDGDTWTIQDFGGGVTWWQYASCPYVDVRGDFMAIVMEWYDTGDNIDTWRFLYTLDGTNFATIWFNMWDGAWVYHPRVTIMDDDEIAVVIEVHDRFDPNPANWYYEGFMQSAHLTGDPASDDWHNYVFYTMSGVQNLDPVAPDVAAYGHEVIFGMTIYNPVTTPLTTHFIGCFYSDYFDDAGGSIYAGCAGTGYLAFDPLDTDDMDYVKYYRDRGGPGVYAVWVNVTDINYYRSPDGGVSFTGNPAAGGDPYKVNMPGIGTHLDAWHSPDVVFSGGKPGVAWHDTRGGDDIYFNTYGNVIDYTIDTYPLDPNLAVWEVGDIPHAAPYSYQWTEGTQHWIEATDQFANATTRYDFGYWWFDGSMNNPEQYTVGGANVNNTAVYDTYYMLTMIGGLGSTIPPTGWQPKYANVTITCVDPPPPGPGSHYTFEGWTGLGNGSYTGPNQTHWVIMNAPITQICNWQLAHEVNIYTDPPGLRFTVEGGNYSGNYTENDPVFIFVDGDIYTIGAPDPQYVGPQERYMWVSWSDLGPQFHNVQVSAPTDFTAYFTAEYSITMMTDPPGLNLSVNMAEQPTMFSFWCANNSQPFIDAPSPQYIVGSPGERWRWESWSDGGAKMHQYTCTGPEVVTAYFVKQYEITFTTSPILPMPATLTIDGNAVRPPHTGWWDENYLIPVEAPPFVSTGMGTRLNFSYWDDFGARIHDHPATQPTTVTAFYDDEVQISLRANHSNLQIRLDGSPVNLPYDYWCELGTNHFVEADTQQFVGSDTRYIYESWDDMGAQNHWISCPGPDVITVKYREEYRVYINTTLDGAASTLSISAGGIIYPTTPAEVWWPSFTLMSLDADEFQPTINPASGTRFKFVDWDDSAIKDRDVNINVAGMAFVANFKTQHKLSITDPQGTPLMNPVGEAVADGYYYDEGTVVTIQTDDTVPVASDERWRFDGWTGNGYIGMDNPAQVTMSGPISQTAAWMKQYLLTISSAYGTPVAEYWYEQESANAYWYDEGDEAYFGVDSEVNISADERAEFESWTGIIPGTDNWTHTTMNSAKVVSSNWDLFYLVLVVSQYGTPTPASAWVLDGGSLAISIDDIVYPTVEHTRYVFDSWTSPNTTNGGYNGDSRQVTLTGVSGPIMETANWDTEYEVKLTHYVDNELSSAPPGSFPQGEGWYQSGTLFVTVSVAGSVTEGDYVYKFLKFTGPGGFEDTLNVTILTINEPKPLDVYWDKSKKEEANILAELWWLWVVIIIVIVVIVVAVLMMRRKPAAPAEEVPPPVEEEPLAEPTEPAAEEAPPGAPPPPA